MDQKTPDQAPDAHAAAAIARVRRLMVIASATTFVAVAFVLVVIGYRLFHWQGSVPAAADVAATLPVGAKVLSSAVGDGRIVLTVEIGGAVELRTYDLNTLKPLGRQKLTAP
jgi:hypothetical protein